MAWLKVHWNSSVMFLNLRCLFAIFNIHFHRSGVSNLSVKFCILRFCTFLWRNLNGHSTILSRHSCEDTEEDFGAPAFGWLLIRSGFDPSSF